MEIDWKRLKQDTAAISTGTGFFISTKNVRFKYKKHFRNEYKSVHNKQ